MSTPLQPPMLHYAIYTNYGRLDAVLDHRIDMVQKMPEWIEVREYHPNVENLLGYLPQAGMDQDQENQSHQIRRVRQGAAGRRI